MTAEKLADPVLLSQEKPTEKTWQMRGAERRRNCRFGSWAVMARRRSVKPDVICSGRRTGQSCGRGECVETRRQRSKSISSSQPSGQIEMAAVMVDKLRLAVACEEVFCKEVQDPAVSVDLSPN